MFGFRLTRVELDCIRDWFALNVGLAVLDLAPNRWSRPCPPGSRACHAADDLDLVICDVPKRVSFSPHSATEYRPTHLQRHG